MVPDFPSDAQEFIQQRINSLEGLEILLLMMGQREQAWTPAEIAKKIYTTEESALNRMTDLAAHELVAADDDPPTRYRYWPRTPELDRLAQNLAKLYAERRTTVTELIFSKPLDKIRTFAEAFRIRRG